jgi:Flp pilus assembly pilin Flp
MFLRLVNCFRRSEHGQDLAEYCLMTAIIALIGLGMFYQLSGGVQGLWGTANSAIVVANSSAGIAVGVPGSGPVDH